MKRVIEIDVFQKPSGEHVCGAGGVFCRFLRTTSLGAVDICAFLEEKIFREPIECGGWTIPRPDCPLK